MANRIKKILQPLVGVALFAFLAWGGWKLLQFLWEIFSQVNPTVGAGMLAASATARVGTIRKA